MTFHLEASPDLRARHSGVTWKSQDSGALSWGTHPVSYGHPVEDQYGGGGLYASAPGYLKLLRSLCFSDGRIIQPATAEVLFSPQLSEEGHGKLNHTLQDPRFRRSLGTGNAQGVEADAAFGGLLAVQDIPGRRRKGSMSGGGLPNLKWRIDPVTKVCDFYTCQLIPAEDPRSLEMFSLFEEHIYRSIGA